MSSGQAAGLQVTLEFPDGAPVQGAKIEVKRSVCDVKVSGFFDQVHDLENTVEVNYYINQ